MYHRKVISLLKHTFVPHKDNNYKPHFFREHVILTILVGAIFLLLVSFTSYIIVRTTTFGSSVVSSVLVDLTNKTRIEHGLPPLFYNPQLFTAARYKGEDMTTRHYFAHFAPDGTSPWHWFDKAGYSFLFAGENLAINFRSSTEVENAWMNSPKHRENILDPRYEDIGIATVPGIANDKEVLFVVQLFGKKTGADVPSSISINNTLQDIHLYQKVIFNASYYIGTIYSLLLIVLTVALLMMIFIEIRKQHIQHILLGVLLGIVVIICIAINSLLL